MAPDTVNTHQQLTRAGGGVAIVACYLPGRQRSFYGFGIYRVNAKGEQLITDPKASWFDHGKKVFRAHGSKEHRTEGLEAAKTYAKDHYGVEGPWVRNRMHDYIPVAINKAFPLRPKS